MTTTLKAVLFAGGILGAAGCGAGVDLSEAERSAVEATLAAYREAWLGSDPERVIDYVSDSVPHFVAGRAAPAVVGKAVLRAFWFPGGDTTYPIRAFDISGQRIHGSGVFAFAEGRSHLAWDTRVGDSVVSSSTSTSDYLTVLRKEAGGWKLYRQMYVVSR